MTMTVSRFRPAHRGQKHGNTCRFIAHTVLRGSALGTFNEIQLVHELPGCNTSRGNVAQHATKSSQDSQEIPLCRKLSEATPALRFGLECYPNPEQRTEHRRSSSRARAIIPHTKLPLTMLENNAGRCRGEVCGEIRWRREQRKVGIISWNMWMTPIRF